MIYGQDLPMTSLPKEFHQTYGSEIAADSVVFRRESQNVISVFLPVFNGWASSKDARVPTWTTHKYQWRLLSNVWHISPKLETLDEVVMPHIEN